MSYWWKLPWFIAFLKNIYKKYVICIIANWTICCRICRDKTDTSYSNKGFIMATLYSKLQCRGGGAEEDVGVHWKPITHQLNHSGKNWGKVREHENTARHVERRCRATIKAWITSSNQTGRETGRKQSSTQTSSPVNKIVWRTEWAAMGWWKSIKSGVRWVFVGGCLLFLPDKNISMLDLVMPREDYRLAGAAVGLTH